MADEENNKPSPLQQMMSLGMLLQGMSGDSNLDPIGAAFWRNKDGSYLEVVPKGTATVGPNQVAVGRWTGPSVGPLSADREQRISQLMKAAIAVHPDNPILQRITVAQAINENGWDVKGLLVNHNNLFGIKGTGTAGSVNAHTWEVYSGQRVDINDNFAANNTIEDSFLQHKKLLEKPRYATVRNAQNFGQAADALLTDGYGTDPHYPTSMKSIDARLQPLWDQVKNEAVATVSPVTASPVAAAPTSLGERIGKGVAQLKSLMSAGGSADAGHAVPHDPVIKSGSMPAATSPTMG